MIFTDREIKEIKNSVIGIAGCGGIGSNTMLNLVRLGFKRFVIADFDRVDESNLNRQFYFRKQIGELKVNALKENLMMIEPELYIETHNTRVDRTNINDIYKRCDYVVEGFDNIQSKILFIETLPKNKKCVSANGLGNYWSVDSIKSRKLSENLTIVGDCLSDTDSGIPALSPGVTIASAKQAAIILQYTIGDLRCLE